MLVDTDVFIWYFRGDRRAFQAVEEESDLCMSVVTYMELVQGVRGGNELRTLRRSLRRWNARLLYVTEEISARAMIYVERHYLSHSLQIADALIGATATVHGRTLLTANDRHYRAVKDISIKRFRPSD